MRQLSFEIQEKGLQHWIDNWFNAIACLLSLHNRLVQNRPPRTSDWRKAAADRNVELKGRRLGAGDYVTKPIDSHNEQSGNDLHRSAQLFHCVKRQSASRLAEPTLSNRKDARAPLPGARVKGAATLGRLIALDGHNRAGKGRRKRRRWSAHWGLIYVR